MNFEYFRHGCEKFEAGLQLIEGRLDANNGQKLQSNCMEVDPRRVAFYYAVRLQAFDTLGDGWLRKSDSLAECGERHSTVELQFLNDAPVNCIQTLSAL